MESNKLLIGVQFIYLKNGTYEHLEFELYVLRDIYFCTFRANSFHDTGTHLLRS